ncbi:hypothetical protein SAMN05421820_111233 [Pedobacter steynii]|jgi:hypothetical protein|uniref:Uncharacterized protein n=1 Tax=Pedobacter steynii TaxID=430522 RepID=A0A1H0GRX8_9SPHI|nr:MULTISPECIES: hypothetical protein [Pedobacter]NQX42509.1 hypothetical protein [Pedobacter steynii]RQO64593.1 hypothetical protein DBR43_32960 [Pedobacter sp. KBW06]SDO09647.1 hypothetical protein SAMN05421820_111233 [Pedobacter steynii]
MMETSTSLNRLNCTQPKQEKPAVDAVIELDMMFYDHIRPQLDRLTRNPSDETIEKILAYSRAK